MGGNISRALWIFVTMAAMVILSIQFVTMKKIATEGLESISKHSQKLTNNILDSEIEKMDQKEMQGADAVNIIKRYQCDLDISINNGLCTEIYNANHTLKENLPDTQEYIKPNYNFITKVNRNSNDIIVGLTIEPR